MKKTKYLKLQIKRAFKIYPSILIITLITLASIILTTTVILHQNSNKGQTKIQLGIVGDTSESYLGVGIKALQNFDSSRFSINFIELDEESAKKSLVKREISGYLRIPDNFITDILYGNNTPVEYVVLNENTGFETAIIREIADIASEWITRTQSSVYGLQSITKDAADSKAQKMLGENITDMNLTYITEVLGRSKSYKVYEIGIADSISTEGYYICGLILFFLLIWGLSCNKLLIKNNLSIPRSLYSRGIKSGWQLLCEFAGFFVCTLTTLLIFSVIFGIVTQNNDFGIKELETSGIFSSVVFIIKIIPVVIMISAMQMMIYELVPGTVNSVVLQFFVAIVLAYISGCFYPNYFFPDNIQKLSSLLPSGIGFSYMRKCLTDVPITYEYASIGLYTAIFALLTLTIRNYRIAGDEK